MNTTTNTAHDNASPAEGRAADKTDGNCFGLGWARNLLVEGCEDRDVEFNNIIKNGEMEEKHRAAWLVVWLWFETQDADRITATVFEVYRRAGRDVNMLSLRIKISDILWRGCDGIFMPEGEVCFDWPDESVPVQERALGVILDIMALSGDGIECVDWKTRTFRAFVKGSPETKTTTMKKANITPGGWRLIQSTYQQHIEVTPGGKGTTIAGIYTRKDGPDNGRAILAVPKMLASMELSYNARTPVEYESAKVAVREALTDAGYQFQD